MKRIIDLAISFLALVILSPLMLLTSVAVLLDVGSPVIFRQARLGKKGTVFYILKFRTMITPLVNQSIGNPLDDNRRLTGLGKFLRKYSLDELPSFWNILKGEMSLVGPRPLLMEYLGTYTERENRRHDVLPGLTGLAQVSGRNSLTWRQKIRLDLFYVAKNNLFLDLCILKKTVFVVLTAKHIELETDNRMPSRKNGRG